MSDAPALTDGIPLATLQSWLLTAQTARNAMMSGQQMIDASYAQGDGQKRVVYRNDRNSLANLSAYSFQGNRFSRPSCDKPQKPIDFFVPVCSSPFMPLDQTAPGAIPASPPIHSDGPPADPQVALAENHLRQLAEMREIGMCHLRDTQAEDKRGGHDPQYKIAQKKAFDTISRSIRQIMALEQEIIGLRAKRVHVLNEEWMRQKAKTVRSSVERSIRKAKPQLDPPSRERLLGDLFRDYRKFADGNIREMIEDICKTLGITADLSLWDEPKPGS